LWVVDGAWLVVSRLVRGFPGTGGNMAEGGKRERPDPCFRGRGGGAEGGAAPGPKNRETANWPDRGARAVETAEREGIWRRRCMSLMYSGSKLCADPNRLTNELEMDTYLDGVAEW
jgi:hypothetical protein